MQKRSRRGAEWFLWVGFAVCAFPCAGQLTQHFEIYGAKSPAHLSDLAAMGFDQFILESNELIAEASRRGLRTVQANWWEKSTPASSIDAQLAFASVQSGLVSVNLMDEPMNDPERFPPELYVDIRSKLRQKYSTVPLSLTLYGPKSGAAEQELRLFADYLPAIDVLRIDPYPVVAQRSLLEVWAYIQRARELLRVQGRQLPLTVILQTWSPGDGADGAPMLPSLAELRVMAYLAMLSEAEVLSFFDYNLDVWNRAPGFAEGFRSLMNELTAFSQELSAAKLKTLAGADSMVRSEVQFPDGHLECVEVNTATMRVGSFPPLYIRRQKDKCPRG